VSDSTPKGDFFNEQPFVKIPSMESIRPKSFTTLKDNSSLKGRRIGVPSMYIGGDDSSVLPVSKVKTRGSIIKLWQEARKALEACGAEVVETDFPLVTIYESNAATGQLVTVADLPEGWQAKERCEVVSHAWDDFVVANGQKDLASLTVVDPDTIFPLAPGSLLGTPEAANKPRWDEIVAYPQTKPSSIFEIPGMKQAIHALENARKATFEDWLDKLGLDAVVFPANGDVGAANADRNEEASLFAWSNGVKYSNGNRPIRHLGIPTISVPMGVMEDTKMPVNLTFAGKAYEDIDLLQYGYAFEMASKCRVQPANVRILSSDRILLRNASRASQGPIELAVGEQVKEIQGSKVLVRVQGSVRASDESPVHLTCYVNGEPCEAMLENGKWSLTTSYQASERDNAWEMWKSPALSQTIVVITAHTGTHTSAGKLILL
jgi:hypothetical protein